MTMTKVLSRYLIPTLRKLFKFIIRKCLPCKKYQATSYLVPNPGPLRKSTTEQCFTFQGRGVNYAGHILYCSTTRKDLKAYILLFSCSVSRALYLVPNLTTSEFIRCPKKLIPMRRRPKVIYSDKPKSFKAGAKLLQEINKDEKWHHHLNQDQIT